MTTNSLDYVASRGTAGIKIENTTSPAGGLGIGMKPNDAMQEAARKAREILEQRRVKAKTAAASGPVGSMDASVPASLVAAKSAKAALKPPPAPKCSVDTKPVPASQPTPLCKQPLMPKLPSDVSGPPPLALALPKSFPAASPPATVAPKYGDMSAPPPVPAAGGLPLPVACKTMPKPMPKQFLVPGSSTSDQSDAPAKKAKAAQPIKDKVEQTAITEAIDQIAVVEGGVPQLYISFCTCLHVIQKRLSAHEIVLRTLRLAAGQRITWRDRSGMPTSRGRLSNDFNLPSSVRLWFLSAGRSQVG